MFKDIDLSIFPKERREKLESIYRYEFFEVMFYRANLWNHSYKVLWLLEEILPVAQKYLQFDAEKARALALVHDDAEMITGDVSVMAKTLMTKKEQKKLESEEEKAIEILCQKYPEKINGYSYRELLLHSIRKDCIEAQLVSYADKIDGYCESLHEVFAGNLSLIGSVIFYANLIPQFDTKFPALTELLASNESPLIHIEDRVSPYAIPIKDYASFNKPFDQESIKVQTDFPFYNTWKKIIIGKGHGDWLINQREFIN